MAKKLAKIKRASDTFIRKWVKALRSGKYKQSVATLKDSRGYCCLGVACAIRANSTRRNDILKFANGYEDEGIVSVSEYAGIWLLPHKDQRKLAAMNDGGGEEAGATFNEIANFIEKKYLKKK